MSRAGEVGRGRCHAAEAEAADLDVTIASKEMGHASITTTVNHYLHLTDEDVTQAVRQARQAQQPVAPEDVTEVVRGARQTQYYLGKKDRQSRERQRAGGPAP